MQQYLFPALFLTSLATLAQADTDSDPSEMVVTATRNETNAKQIATATTVYTRQDIERKQVKTLPDLLKGTVGLDLVQNGGGYGKVTNIFMRGSNSNQTLVLIDGIRAGSVTSGTTPFENIPIDQIERVEITRGPGSSLYGSEAIGGIIQIFTRKNTNAQTPKVSLITGGGSYDTAQVAGNVAGSWKNSWYNLGVSHLTSAGINARQPLPGPYGYSQPDRDGFDNTGINARAGHKFSNGAELEAFFMHAEGNNAYDADYGGDHNAFINQNVGLKGSWYFADDWRSSLNLGRTIDYYDSFCPESPSKNNFPCQQKANGFDSRFNSTRWNASWLNELQLSDTHKFSFGTDYRVDEADSNTQYSRNPNAVSDLPGGMSNVSRYDVGVFGELQSQLFDQHFVNASLRWDHNEAAGNYISSNVGWRYLWVHDLSVFASFGNAFRAPSFNDLYYPQYGNPKLKAEESTEFEVGIAGKHKVVQWELRGYHKNIDNLIIASPDPQPNNPYKYKADNVDKAQIDGLEGSVSTQVLGWKAQLGMSLMSPVNRITNARLARRTDKSLSFDLSKSLGDVDLGVFVLAQAMRYDSPNNNKPVAGYVTADLRASYHIDPHWTLSAKLNNVFDRDYQLVDTYNTFGRNFFFTVQYNN